MGARSIGIGSDDLQWPLTRVASLKVTVYLQVEYLKKDASPLARGH